MLIEHDEQIQEIAKALHILKDAEESSLEWACRVIYSMSGRMALAALWDEESSDTSGSISLQHFKRAIENVMYAYGEMYPTVKKIFFKGQKDASAYTEELYNLYGKTGAFYHCANELRPSIHRFSTCENISFERGVEVSRVLYMCGLGLYRKLPLPIEENSITEMFQLQETSLEESATEFLSKLKWADALLMEEVEFLNITPSRYKKYWKNTPDKTGVVSLMRVGAMFPKQYFMYRYVGDSFQQAAIPLVEIEKGASEIEKGAYWLIANRILATQAVLPPIKVHKSNECVTISLGYLLPPQEENFFLLYSWPLQMDDVASGSLNNRLQRRMSMMLYPAFKNVFEKIGYEFVEE